MTVATLPESTATLAAERSPAWEIALLFPDQETWSVYDYFDLPSKQLVEFDNGRIEVLPMPSIRHQVMLQNILVPMLAHVEANALGTVLSAPMPLQVAPLKFREPDVIFRRSAAPQESDLDAYLDSAELVVEVLSEGPTNRQREIPATNVFPKQGGSPSQRPS